MYFLILTTVTMTSNAFGLGEEADFEVLNFLPALNPLFCQTPIVCGYFLKFSRDSFVCSSLGSSSNAFR